MLESEFMFHLLYILLIVCLLYPPVEIISLGFTVENLFSKYIGIETNDFVQYHIRRTTLTIFIHSLLPLGYVVIYRSSYYDAQVFSSPWSVGLWNCIAFAVAMLPLITCTLIWIWFQNHWEKHPLCKTLLKFTNNNSRWETIAEDINFEFIRDDKIVIRSNSIHTIIATENWIIKVTPYQLLLGHQSDTALIALSTDSHAINPDTSDSVQFVNIEVKPTRNGVRTFKIRINALDFRDLQDRINRPITILMNVQFHQTIMDRWIEVFKEQINLNPRYDISREQITESCFACMISEPNIKLQKHCLDLGENGEIIQNQNVCGNCYCRPMWCVACMAKWFASRQNQFEHEVWLEQKCTCPMCRASFCMLDVCYINKID